MNEKHESWRTRFRELTVKATKATIKGAIFYMIYFVLSILLAPISDVVPSFQQTVENFIIVYIVLIVIGEFTAKTIYQHFFNAAKALFVILYLILSLKGGIVGLSIEDIRFVVDLRLFLTVAMLLGLLGFAKSVLQAISFLSQRAEKTHIYPQQI